MNIFIVVNKTTFENNPYISQLVLSLTEQDLCVSHGSFRDLMENYDIKELDIIHIHWPTDILDFQDLTQLNYSKALSSLFSLSQHVPIVSTIHNLYPHSDQSQNGFRFHLEFYRICSGLIHLGEYSCKLFRDSLYVNYTKKSRMTVIKHGNYNCYGEPLATQINNYSRPKVITLGAIRAKCDLDLIFKFARVLRRRNNTLHLYSTLQFPKPKINCLIAFFKRIFIELLLIYSKIRLFLSTIECSLDFIEPNSIQQLLSDSNIFFLPRSDCLNSGLVSLAFTYGNVVIGPAVGNIKTELSSTNNALYKDSSFIALDSAFLHALDLYRNNQGNQNRDYSQNSLGWNSIAIQHLDFYNQILQKV